MDFNVLERSIFNHCKKSFDSEEFSRQIESAEMIKRSYTGVGFYVDIRVDPQSSPLPLAQFNQSPFNGPNVISPQLIAGALTLLYFDESRHIDCIEICSYSDEFPEQLIGFELQALD